MIDISFLDLSPGSVKLGPRVVNSLVNLAREFWPKGSGKLALGQVKRFAGQRHAAFIRPPELIDNVVTLLVLVVCDVGVDKTGDEQVSIVDLVPLLESLDTSAVVVIVEDAIGIEGLGVLAPGHQRQASASAKSSP